MRWRAPLQIGCSVSGPDLSPPRAQFPNVKRHREHIGYGNVPPNMRLKLPGGDPSKGSGVLCPCGHELSFNDTPHVGRVARSLTAIR